MVSKARGFGSGKTSVGLANESVREDYEGRRVFLSISVFSRALKFPALHRPSGHSCLKLHKRCV